MLCIRRENLESGELGGSVFGSQVVARGNQSLKSRLISWP